MSTKSRLDALYKSCERIRFPEDVKILFIADTHMGDGGPEDDFKKNDPKCQEVSRDFLGRGYIIVFLGDVVDLWECPNERAIMFAHLGMHTIITKAEDEKRAIEIKGNHDNRLNLPEAIVLQIGDLEIFCCHGHQGDFWNDTAWWIGENFVRYLWVPLQWLGFHDPVQVKKKRHEAQEARLVKWTKSQNFRSVFGHTHLLWGGASKYLNAGSWVNQGGEAIEFANGVFTERRFVC